MCTQEFSQFLAGTQCLPDMCDMQCIQIDSRCHMKCDARHLAWARPASSSCSGSSRSVRNGMAAVPAKRYWDRGTSSLSGRSLFAGRDSAWLGSASIGLRKLCLSHPQSVRLLTSFIAFIAPEFYFSSLVLIDGIASPVHKDAANSNLPNVVIPLSSFSGGGLKVAHSSGSDVILHDGQHLPAVHLRVSEGPAVFSASACLHEVQNFDGRRLVLVAYTLQACDRMTPDLSATLLSLGPRV